MKRRPSPQDITWFLDLYRNKQLDLSPSYQRKSVWTLKDRKYFLDSVFRQYPCPPIFLYQSKDEEGRGTYHVVDGKQRLETVIKFTANEFPLGESVEDLGLANKKWNELSQEQKRGLWDYVFTAEFLSTTEGPILDEIFARINTNSRKLERQELRHARWDGWFVGYAEEEAEHKEEWKTLKVVTTARAKRMKDVQFLSELFLVVLDGRIVGFDQDYLDGKYAEFDNPQETQANFSEEEFIARVQDIKSYLIVLETYNACITKYAKTFINFYSLWAVVALNLLSLPDPIIVVDRYSSFMEKVLELGRLRGSGIGIGTDTTDPTAEKYYLNTVGANTDLAPRQARYEALISVLLGANDENTSVNS